MTVTKRDLELAALRWKAHAESMEAQKEELKHALNLLVNDSVEWFARHQASNGVVHEFGIGIAKEIPIKGIFLRTLQGADVENVPLVFWKSIWPDGYKLLHASSPEGFKGLQGIVAKCEDPQLGEELAKLIGRVSLQVDQACREYLAREPKPVVH